jgi:hypothetical protein
METEIIGAFRAFGNAIIARALYERGVWPRSILLHGGSPSEDRMKEEYTRLNQRVQQAQDQLRILEGLPV